MKSRLGLAWLLMFLGGIILLVLVGIKLVEIQRAPLLASGVLMLAGVLFVTCCSALFKLFKKKMVKIQENPRLINGVFMLVVFLFYTRCSALYKFFKKKK